MPPAPRSTSELSSDEGSSTARTASRKSDQDATLLQSPASQQDSSQDQDPALIRRLETERRRQLLVLCALAAAILLVSVLRTGLHNIFLPGWWHIDLP